MSLAKGYKFIQHLDKFIKATEDGILKYVDGPLQKDNWADWVIQIYDLANEAPESDLTRVTAAIMVHFAKKATGWRRL